MGTNLKFWESVEKTDPKHTRKANVKGNKITAISPQYQIYQATNKWGMYGQTWGFKEIDVNMSGDLVLFKGLFYYPEGEFPIISSISIWRDNDRTKLDDDFAKKVETDALTKALSKLGFNADVFMGRYDDNRYVAEVMEEFKEKTPYTESMALAAAKKKTPIDEFKSYVSVSVEQEEAYNKMLHEYTKS